MTTERSKRIVDKELVEYVKKLPCVATGKNPGGDAHHVTSVGARGNDEARNLMPLTRACHVEVHKIGWNKFCAKYPGVLEWLKRAGRTDVIERMNRA